MVELFAQPYDLNADGFYFESMEMFEEKAKSNCNSYGDPVEEYEIQFIDGEDLESDLAKVWGLNQANIAAFLDAVEEWEEGDILHYVIVVGECGYDHDQFVADPSGIDIDLYELDNMKELAEHFVEEGLFGDIPECLSCYLDYDAIARDLSFDYSETVIAGRSYIYRCA